MAGRLRPGRIGRIHLSDDTSDGPRRILFLFVDGVGLGTADPAVNPFAAVPLPAFDELLGGGRLVADDVGSGPLLAGMSATSAIDATLSVPGLPQSGTGQTSLLTGANGALMIGRHFGPWVPTGLRPLLAEQSIFRTLMARGREVTLANAYPAAYRSMTLGPGSRRPGAVPLAAGAAGLLDRDEASLRAGDAVVSSITTDGWRRHVDPDAPVVLPFDAGRTLAGIAARYDFTFFAHFETDHIGHRGSFADAVRVIQRLDEFVGGVLEFLSADTLLVVTSDHGNIEDISGGHTLNPVPFIAHGPGSSRLAMRVSGLTDVAPSIDEMIGGVDSSVGAGGAG